MEICEAEQFQVFNQSVQLTVSWLVAVLGHRVVFIRVCVCVYLYVCVSAYLGTI